MFITDPIILFPADFSKKNIRIIHQDSKQKQFRLLHFYYNNGPAIDILQRDSVSLQVLNNY